MEELLEEFIKECSAYTKTGAVANYIPELTKADQDMLGVYIKSPVYKQTAVYGFTSLL